MADADTGQTPMRRRRRLAVHVVVFCLLAGLVGVVAAHFVKSPAERAAASAPPAPAQLTAEVARRVLTNDVVARGTVKAAGTVEVTPSAAFGAEVTTISRKPLAAGDPVHAGEVALEVSGRPLVVLHGSLPAYRSLTEGDTGRDVVQLQRALGAVGHPSGDRSGTFGDGTANALRAFYEAIGYAPATKGDAVVLPVSEVAYVPRFPARIAEFDGKVGRALASPALVISYGALGVHAHVDPTDAALVARGQRAKLTGSDGRTINGEVGRVPLGVSTTIGPDGAYVSVPIDPDEPLPASWNGDDIEIDITAATTHGPVTIVPFAAISTSADGSTSVTRVSGGRSTVVRVDAGVSANGFVEVTATDGTLRAGDQVVVGAR